MKTTVNEAENEDDGATTYTVLGISNNDTQKKNINVSILRNHDHRKKFQYFGCQQYILYIYFLSH